MLTDGSGLAHVVDACRLPVIQEMLARVGIAMVGEVRLRRDVEVSMAQSGSPRIVVVTERHGWNV